MASTSFVPKGQKGLLLRSPLTLDFSPPSDSKKPKPIYSRHFDQSLSLSKQDQEILMAGGTPKKIGFYTRNNPHPGRVRHMKGLNDIPICFVEDQIQRRFLMSAPSGQDLGPGYRPPGNTRYSANYRGKGISAVGIIPVTFSWRDELEKKTQNALHRAMGNILPPSRGGLLSRSSQRGASQFDTLGDNQILDLLCRILQTDSIPACQAWLNSASETEKNIVLNMIRMAATGEFDGASMSSQSKASDQSDIRYIWAPGNSHAEQPEHYSYLQSDDEFDFDHEIHRDATHGGAAGLQDPEPFQPPFKFPEHDTVIKTARQLSSLASRQSSRAERLGHLQTMGEMGLGIPQRNAHPEPEHFHVHPSREHPRSVSLSGPMPTGSFKSINHRPRSRSANTPIRQKDTEQYPPPPVRVSVSKENIQVGKPGSGRHKLRYTSHWD